MSQMELKDSGCETLELLLATFRGAVDLSGTSEAKHLY